EIPRDEPREAEARARGRDVGMGRALRCDHEPFGALEERNDRDGLAVVAHREREVAQMLGERRMVGAERGLVDGDRALEEPSRVAVAADAVVGHREPVEALGELWMMRPEDPLAQLRAALVRRDRLALVSEVPLCITEMRRDTGEPEAAVAFGLLPRFERCA